MKKSFRIFLTLFLLLSILPVSSLAGEPDAGTGFEVTAERDGNNWNAEVRVPADAEGCQLLIALYEANGKLITVKSKVTSGAGTYQAQFSNAPENVTVRAFLLSEGNKPRSGVAPATAKYLTVGAAQKVDEGKYRLTGGVYQDITIPESIGNGDVTLENVTVTGKLIVLGGGSNSIHLDSCSVDAIQVNKDVTAQDAEQPRIELNDTQVEKIEAIQPVIIEATSENSTIKEVEAQSDVTVQGENTKVENVTAAAENVKLTVQDAAVEKVTAEKPVTIEATSENSTIKAVEAKSDVTVQGAATKVESVTVPETAAAQGVKLTVDGAKVETVAAEKPVTIEATNGASPIETVEAKDNVTVQGAQIETVTVPKNVTTKPEITVTTGTVSTVEAKSETVVSGAENTVANVKAEAAVEVASETVVTVTVTVQVTVTVTGNSDVEVAVETTEAVKIAAESAQVSVSTTQTAEVSVQVNNTAVGYIHKWRETGRTDATCKTEGSVTYSCSCEGTCELGGTKTETLAKLPHKEVIDEAVPATCTETGLTAGKHCSVCGEALIAQQTVPATGHRFASAWSCDEIDHWHAATCGHDEVEGKAPHVWDDGTVTTPAEGAQDGVMTYTCTVCGHTRTEVIPASFVSVSTLDGLIAAMESETLSGAVLAEDITVPGGTLPAGKTLIVPADKTLTVAGILNVYGTLVNEGTVSNQVFLDVFGTLSNSGTINGDWFPLENGEFFCNSNIGIENGATLTNSGTVNDFVVAADYYYAGEDGKLCKLPEGLEIAEKIAVAFGAEQTKRCLALPGYDVVVPVGNVELGDVTIPAGKILRVKNSVFDGEQTYEGNSVTVGNLTAEGGIIPYGGVEVLPGGSLTVTGSLTLATSSVDYQMDDTGYIRVMAGGSLTVGDVQYVGENGALTLDADSLLVLNGLPRDAATAEKPIGIFTILMGNAAVEKERTFTVPAAWDNFIIPPECTLSVRGTLTNNSRIENRGEIEVTGTLANHGGIDNQNTIFVFCGKLENHGVINGERQTDENGFPFWQSIIGIENGARLESDFAGASIHDYIEAVDYWDDGEPVKCSWDAAFDPASGDFEVVAAAFGTEQIKAALNATSTWGENNEHTVTTYEQVVACGTKPAGADGSTVNTVKLGGITVNPYQKLILCSWMAGSDLYLNDYVIGEGETLTLNEGAGLECRNWGGTRTLTIDGEIVNNGGYIDFGGMTVAGKKIIHNEKELAVALKNGGMICLYPLAREEQTDVSAVFGNPAGTDFESQYHLDGACTIGKNTTLIALGGEPIAVFFDGGFTVSRGADLSFSGFNLVAGADSTVYGTVETHNGQVVVQGKDGTTLTISEGGRIVVGQPNEWGALAIYAAEGVRNRIVNNGTIESFGGLFFDRDPENGQFEGNEPLEYANLRDLVCELYHRFDGYPNMESVDYETTDEYGIADLHWVYAYPDGGSQMYNEENPDDSDYDALGAFSWFIKNGVIPEYNKETNPKLRPYDLINRKQAAELMNRLGKRISGADGLYSTLSGDGLLSRGELDQTVSELEIAVRRALGEVIVRSEEELIAALREGGRIIIEGTDEFVTVTENDRIIILENPVTVSKNTELVNQFGNILYIPGLTVNEGAALTVSNMTVVLAADSTISGTLQIGGDCFVLLRTPDEAQIGEVTVLTVAESGRIVIGGEDMSYWDAALGSRDGKQGGGLINNGVIDVYGDLWFENVSGVNYLFIAEVNSREELFEAMDDIIIRQVIFTGDVALYSGDHIMGRGMHYEIPENITVTLEKGEKDEPVFLDQGSDMKVYGELIANYTLYAYSGIWTPDYEPRENHLINDYNIHFLKNFADFGEFVCNAVGDRLKVTDEDIRDYGDMDADNWPGGEWNEYFFAFLVKYGGVQPRTDEYNEGRVYWPTWEPITYGDAMSIVGNVWKAICGEDEPMPEGVCLKNVFEKEHMDDERCNALLGAFAVALPRQEDTRTEITLIRDNMNQGDASHGNDGMTISGKKFTKHITITCDPQYLNGDDFGGDLKFVNCEFAGGVTVKMTGGINYNVRLNNNCTGTFTVTADDDVIGQNRTGVSFFGMNGVTINGLHISGKDMADVRDDDFNVNVRYDREGENSYIPTLEIVNLTKGTVALTGAYKGKLRTAGWLDVRGVTLTGENSRIELSNQCDCEIALGNNNILVNDDCGGCYSFTGTGKVTVCNQNQYADITVNGIHLGTPHIFGEHSDGIYLGLTDLTGVTFKLEQGTWDDVNKCVSSWTKIENFKAVLYNDDGPVDENNTKPATKLHLERDGDNPWITDPYQVKLTVTVGGCAVVYDTVMWKPISEREFVERLNQMLGTDYTFEARDVYLSYGTAKQMLSTVLDSYETEVEKPTLRQIINDDNYWGQRDDWNQRLSEAENPEKWLEENEGWNPDYWTWDWFFANDVIGSLKSALGIKDVYGDVTVHVERNSENGRETFWLETGESWEDWVNFDDNRIANASFTGAVDIVCDTKLSEGDNWGGCVCFENCEFVNGVTAKLQPDLNYGLRFYDCIGSTVTLADRYEELVLAPLTFSGSSIAIDVRYDENGRTEDGDRMIYIATADVRGENKDGRTSEERISVSGTGFDGKLRISGNADVSGLSFGENGWLELSNNGESSIALGSNAIRVNDDCGCSYSFTGTGKVTVCNQNQYADIMVNGKHLGTPHIFGRGGFGIFFPLTGSEGVSFKVEQGRWNEDKQCAEDWRTLEYTVETKADGSGIHLNPADGEPWITDPCQVRVTVTVGGCTVVYDTLMWKGE